MNIHIEKSTNVFANNDIFRIKNFTQFFLSVTKILTLSWNIETFEADTDPAGVGAVLRANDATRRDATRRVASRRTPLGLPSWRKKAEVGA